MRALQAAYLCSTANMGLPMDDYSPCTRRCSCSVQATRRQMQRLSAVCDTDSGLQDETRRCGMWRNHLTLAVEAVDVWALALRGIAAMEPNVA
jgi:hypothetical protein